MLADAREPSLSCRAGSSRSWYEMNGDSTYSRLIKFVVGLLLLGGLAFCLGTGITPPGKAGEVIRHNQESRVDATALFYSDLENMQELERGVVEMQAGARDSRAIANVED